jgi:prolyl 4-hydroxylase
MRSHILNPIPGNFILGWYMEDTTLCDRIIDWFNKVEDREYGFIYNEFGDKVVDKRIKDSIDYNLCKKELLDEYNIHLQAVLKRYQRIYPLSAYTDNIEVLKPPNIQYYPPRGGFKIWHSERLSCVEPGVSRHLAFMTYLNDVTDKGGTQFYHQRINLRPEKGLTVIWPVDWTHFHRGVSSPTQEKYIVTGWFNFVPNKTNNKKPFPAIRDPGIPE